MTTIKCLQCLSEEGVHQGGPEGPVGFCMTIHSSIMEASVALRQHGGIDVFDMDDSYLAGPLHTVMTVVAKLGDNIKRRCGIDLNPRKSELYSADSAQVTDYLRDNPQCQFKMGTGGGRKGVIVS